MWEKRLNVTCDDGVTPIQWTKNGFGTSNQHAGAFELGPRITAKG